MLPKVFVSSFPKGGTNLVAKLLEQFNFSIKTGLSSALIFGKYQFLKKIVRGSIFSSDSLVIGVDVPVMLRKSWVVNRLKNVGLGEVAVGHVPYSEQFSNIIDSFGFKRILIIRDPRDIVVSHAHYVSSNKDHFLYRYYQSLPNSNQRIKFSMTGGYVRGVGYLESINSRALSLEGWMRKEETLILKFESLVGPEGGGSRELQWQEIFRLCNFLEIEVTQDQVARSISTLFGGTRTFRKGLIGGWKEELNPGHINLFNQLTGDLLNRWSYEDSTVYQDGC